MQPQQSSRIDLGELKAQIVKKLGQEKSKKYFSCLEKLLNGEVKKSDFVKLCHQWLGREVFPLHNQLLMAVLKNACQAETPPPTRGAGPAKAPIQAAKSSAGIEDGQDLDGSTVPNQSVSTWSNGVLPVSPKKVRSGIQNRKIRDRPSPLGPNGKLDCVAQQSTGAEDIGRKAILENGDTTPCDYQRPIQHLQAVAEQPNNEIEGSALRPEKRLKSHGNNSNEVALANDVEELEQWNLLDFSRNPLIAPLGIPYFSPSIGGARKSAPVGSTGNFVTYHDSGGLSDTETLRKRMEQIAVEEGLGGVSMECANILNTMLDAYLKRLIRPCVEQVRVRHANNPRRRSVQQQQQQQQQEGQGKVINGMWPRNHLHIQSGNGSLHGLPEQKPQHLISMLDFKVAMELDRQKLGEDWPLQLEKISMRSFEEERFL